MCDGKLESIKINGPSFTIESSHNEVGEFTWMGDVTDEKKSEAASVSSVSNHLPPPDLLSSPSSLCSLPFLSFPLLFDPTSSSGRKKVKASTSSDSASIFRSSASWDPPPLSFLVFLGSSSFPRGPTPIQP